MRGIHFCPSCKVNWTPEDLAEAEAEEAGEEGSPYDDCREVFYEETRRGVKGSSHSGGKTRNAKDMTPFSRPKGLGIANEWWKAGDEDETTKVSETTKVIEKKTEAFHFRIKRDVHTRLKAKAKAEGISLSAYIRRELLAHAKAELDSCSRKC